MSLVKILDLSQRRRLLLPYDEFPNLEYAYDGRYLLQRFMSQGILHSLVGDSLIYEATYNIPYSCFMWYFNHPVAYFSMHMREFYRLRFNSVRIFDDKVYADFDTYLIPYIVFENDQLKIIDKDCASGCSVKLCQSFLFLTKDYFLASYGDILVLYKICEDRHLEPDFIFDFSKGAWKRFLSDYKALYVCYFDDNYIVFYTKSPWETSSSACVLVADRKLGCVYGVSSLSWHMNGAQLLRVVCRDRNFRVYFRIPYQRLYTGEVIDNPDPLRAFEFVLDSTHVNVPHKGFRFITGSNDPLDYVLDDQMTYSIMSELFSSGLTQIAYYSDTFVVNSKPRDDFMIVYAEPWVFGGTQYVNINI